MTKQSKKYFSAAAWLLADFLLWTLALRLIDVQAIGPQESSVGFASLNQLFHNLTGANMSLYTITDWLGLVPFVFAGGFAVLGLAQWIHRKSLKQVDRSLFVLGGFYVAVMAAYLLFELVEINYRPVLIEGVLEASYPSSTTLMVLCVMPTAIMQFNSRIRNESLKKCVAWAIAAFTVFMVVGRLISGVHWLTDIIGGCLLSAGLVMLYCAVIRLKDQ